jgi:hypothetical protein
MRSYMICTAHRRKLSRPGNAVRIGDRRCPYGVLMGKPQGKIQLGRPRCSWAGNINMDIQEVGWGGAWMGLIWIMIGTTYELFRTRL